MAKSEKKEPRHIHLLIFEQEGEPTGNEYMAFDTAAQARVAKQAVAKFDPAIVKVPYYPYLERAEIVRRLNKALAAEDRAWIAARLLEAKDVDDQSDEFHHHFEALFDLVDKKVMPKEAP